MHLSKSVLVSKVYDTFDSPSLITNTAGTIMSKKLISVDMITTAAPKAQSAPVHQRLDPPFPRALSQSHDSTSKGSFPSGLDEKAADRTCDTSAYVRQPADNRVQIDRKSQQLVTVQEGKVRLRLRVSRKSHACAGSRFYHRSGIEYSVEQETRWPASSGFPSTQV